MARDALQIKNFLSGLMNIIIIDLFVFYPFGNLKNSLLIYLGFIINFNGI